LSVDPVSNPTLEVHPHTIKTVRPGVPKCQLEIDRFGPNWDDPRNDPHRFVSRRVIVAGVLNSKHEVAQLKA
jgi:hypothetical protein